MRSIMFLLLILLISFSCENEKEIIYPTDLIGKWDWVVSFSGWGATYTPKVLNEKIIIEFTTDSIYREYSNDSLRLEDNYKLNAGLINYDKSSIRHSFVIKRDTLILTAQFYDGVVSQYKWIK